MILPGERTDPCKYLFPECYLSVWSDIWSLIKGGCNSQTASWKVTLSASNLIMEKEAATGLLHGIQNLA